MTNYSPKEEDEQRAFVQYLRMRNIPHHHCANESNSGTRNAMIRGAKMKSLGTSRGFPDLLIFLPIYDVFDEIGAYRPLAIELKRQKGGAVSSEQKELF